MTINTYDINKKQTEKNKQEKKTHKRPPKKTKQTIKTKQEEKRGKIKNK